MGLLLGWPLWHAVAARVLLAQGPLLPRSAKQLLCCCPPMHAGDQRQLGALLAERGGCAALRCGSMLVHP